MNTNTTKKNDCLCGCGTKVRHNFAQGHDQRVRGMLQRGETTPGLKAAMRAGRLRKHVTSANARLLKAAA